MKEQQYQQYMIWREQMIILGDVISDTTLDDDGTFVIWSAQDPEARNDFNETLWQHSLDHVSVEVMQVFEDEYDANL